MRVYLFRGLAGMVFSRGLDHLAESLDQAGHHASVHAWTQRQKVQNKAISDYRNGLLLDSIAIIGHSLGGNSANFMANKLVSNNIPVTYVATIDPTAPQPNPISVKSDNFRSRDFRAEKVPGATDIFRPDLNHIQIDKDNRVHNRILAACERENDSYSNQSYLDETMKPAVTYDSESVAALLRELISRIEHIRSHQ